MGILKKVRSFGELAKAALQKNQSDSNDDDVSRISEISNESTASDRFLQKLKHLHKKQTTRVHWADGFGNQGTSGDRLRELQILEQIAEARYEAYRDNMLPGLEEKERELLSLRQEIADLEAAKQASEEALLRTEHEMESPEEYDRSSMSNHLGNWNDLRDCVIDVAGFKLREMNPTLHPDSFATCRGYPAGTELEYRHVPFRQKPDGTLSLNVLGATNAMSYNDLINFIHLLVPPGENLRMGRKAERRSAMTPYDMLYRLNPDLFF